MSQTDIYKNRERVQTASTASRFKKSRRRRSSRSGPFDESGERRRRSKNSGMRRMLHLWRRSSDEKIFWQWFLGVIVVILVLLAIWQFWYLEYAARRQSSQNEGYVPLHSSTQTDSAAE